MSITRVVMSIVVIVEYRGAFKMEYLRG